MEQCPLKHGGEYTLINMFIGCAMCIHLSCPFLNPFIHLSISGLWVFGMPSGVAGIYASWGLGQPPNSISSAITLLCCLQSQPQLFSNPSNPSSLAFSLPLPGCTADFYRRRVFPLVSCPLFMSFIVSFILFS